jgi:hypothetical protein
VGAGRHNVTLAPSEQRESLAGILGAVAPDDSRPRAAGLARACLLGVMRKRSPGRTSDSSLVSSMRLVSVRRHACFWRFARLAVLRRANLLLAARGAHDADESRVAIRVRHRRRGRRATVRLPRCAIHPPNIGLSIRGWCRAPRVHVSRTGGTSMSHLGPVRLVGALLAVAAVAALTTGGIALAQGGHHHAAHARRYHAAKASVGALPRPAAKAASAGCPNWVPANGSAPPTPPPGTLPKGTMSLAPANGSAPPTPPPGVPASSCEG